MGRVGAVIVVTFAVGVAACTVSPVAKEKPIDLPERDLQEAEANVTPPASSPQTPPSTPQDNGPKSTPDAGTDADAAPPVSVGQWYQANNAECVSFCATKSLLNVPSPEGAKCTSGENIPQSAITAKIVYNDCYPDCQVHLKHPNARSFEDECYGDDQKQDGDGSDKTRGCFCK